MSCLPGVTEFSNVAKLYSQWNRNRRAYPRVSVADNRSLSRVRPLSNSRGWDFDVYLGPNQDFKRAMNVPFCPYAFVLDGQGVVVWSKAGYTPGDKDVIHDIVRKAGKGEPVE